MTTFLLDVSDSLIKLFYLMKESLMSSDFYRKVYSQFSGFGIRYLFTLCFVGTLISAIIIMIALSPISKYFENKIVTNKITANIDATLSNWQPINYTGSTIISNDTEPVMLKGVDDKVILAIDAKDQLTGSIKKNIPVVFGKSRLLVNIVQNKEEPYQFSYDYSGVFGENKKIIDADDIVVLLKNYLKYFDYLYIFLIFPLMLALNFVTIIFEKTLMVILIYFALKIFVNSNSTIKSAIRTVAFSAGITALLLPLAMLSSTIATISNFLQLWTSFLIIRTIMSMKPQKIE